MTDEAMAGKAAFYFRSLSPQDRTALANVAEEPAFWRNKFPGTNEVEFGDRLKELTDDEVGLLLKSIASNPNNWTKPSVSFLAPPR